MCFGNPSVMGIIDSVSKKPKPVYKLRDKKSFDSFTAHKTYSIIVAYHYLCPECETYLKQFKKIAVEYENENDLLFGKIHIQLDWMIEKAGLTGDVTEENVFLKELGVGSAVPATLFFRDGSLVWHPEGALPPPVFRGLVKKLMESE
jgi:hypothetical protein